MTPVPSRAAMCWSPSGKFNSYFSIVSALRGQYITVNEPCHFYYQWSTTPEIKTRLHIPPHLPGLTKQPCLISLLLQAPSLLRQPSGPRFFFGPSCFFLSLLVCLLSYASSGIENDTAAAPRIPTITSTAARLLSAGAPTLPGVFTGGPIMKGLGGDIDSHRRALGALPYGSQPPGSGISAVCCRPGSHESIFSVGFLS